MFNHARCLLANLPYVADPSYYWGEEPIPFAFSPVVLPDAVARFRAALIGSAPDREMVNYRCAQLLHVVRLADMDPVIDQLDPRKTPAVGLGGLPILPASSARTAAGTAKMTLLPGPAPALIEGQGWLRFDFGVSVASGTATIVDLERLGRTASVPLTLTSGLTQPFPLLDSGYSARLNGLTDGDLYTVTVRQKPLRDIAGLMRAAAGLDQETIENLFGGTGRFVADRRRMGQEWSRLVDGPDRLAAITVAAILRTADADPPPPDAY